MIADLQLTEFVHILQTHLNLAVAHHTQDSRNGSSQPREIRDREIEEALEAPGRTIFVYGEPNDGSLPVTEISTELCSPNPAGFASADGANAPLTVVLHHQTTKEAADSVVVVDEFDRATTELQRSRLADFLKQIAEHRIPIRFVLCGVSELLRDVLSVHESSYTYLEDTHSPSLDAHGIFAIASAQQHLKSGEKHYVHLISEKLFWELFNDPTFARSLR
jgi:hypothetical protein